MKAKHAAVFIRTECLLANGGEHSAEPGRVNGGTLEPKDLRRRIGIEFEKHVAETLVIRRKSKIDEKRDLFSLRTEFFGWGETLIGLLGSAKIEQWAFDRVVDAVVERHNAKISQSEKELAAQKKKKHIDEKPISMKELRETMKEIAGPERITLGQALGA